MASIIILCAAFQALVLLWAAWFGLCHVSQPVLLQVIPLMMFAGANVAWQLGRLVG